ncbi:MAG: glutamate--tRNA ligase [Phycisphaeraceae bacterium]|nr:glutamate--tRNA ligase [Phycisphaeraceae bacterium]
MPDSPVITRFAPSPTGHLHIGGARTALFCWALARRLGGRFLLRIEDTDRARSSESATVGILQDLAWLGVEWDEGPRFDVAPGRTIGGDPRSVGPFYQAQRIEIYDRWIDWLIERDLAYPAFDSGEEIEAARRAAQAAKRTYRYKRAADYDRPAALRRMRDEPHVVRFNMPERPVRVMDDVLGEVSFNVEDTDDLVIRKADGFPTYHFAVVIDDELMGVTHVLRGQEHLNNTPRHVALQGALAHEDGTPFRTPRYAHLPLIFNPDGSKMGKRDKDKAARAACRERGIEAPPVPGIEESVFSAWLDDAKSQLETHALERLAAYLAIDLPEIEVADFRRSGYDPEAVCNYLALLGWNPGLKNPDGTDVERWTKDFLAKHFATDRIGKKNAQFDRTKLLAFNADRLQKDMDDRAFLAAWRDWATEHDPPLATVLAGTRGELMARAARPRTRILREASAPVRFALIADDAVEFDAKAVEKALSKGEPNGMAMLAEIRAVIAGIEPFTPQAIDAAITAWAQQRGVGMGKVAQPLRVAVTGATVSPGLGETLALVGAKGALARIDRCLKVNRA